MSAVPIECPEDAVSVTMRSASTDSSARASEPGGHAPGSDWSDDDETIPDGWPGEASGSSPPGHAPSPAGPEDSSEFILPLFERLEQVHLCALGKQERAGETDRARMERRVNTLLERALDAHRSLQSTMAVVALDLAFREDPERQLVDELVCRHASVISEIYHAYLGDTGKVPSLSISQAELCFERIDSRAAFMLSRVDGMMSLDDILCVVGMPRLEALHHASVLLLRGVLRTC